MIAHATSSCFLPPSCRRPGRCRQAVSGRVWLASVLMMLAPLRRNKNRLRSSPEPPELAGSTSTAIANASSTGRPVETAIRAPVVVRTTWFLINFNTHKRLEVVRPRQESRPSLCTVLTKSTPRAKYTFTDGRRHRCRPPALRRPAVRGDGRPRRRGASGVHFAALLQLHDVDAHVPAFEAAPLRYTRPTVRDVFVARRAIRGHARRRGRRDCRALRRWCEGRGVRVHPRLRASETAPARAPRRGLWRARAPRGRVVSKTAATTKCR